MVRSRAPGRFKNALLALVVASALGGSWYFWNSAFFFDKAFGLLGTVTAEGADPHTLSGWLFYIKQLPFQLGVPSLIFTGLGLVLAVVSRLRTKRLGDGLLWMWFLS